MESSTERHSLLNERNSIVSSDEKTIRLLIVDKHEAVRRALRIRLSVPKNIDVVGVAPDLLSATELNQLLEPDVIILGLQKGSDEEFQRLVICVQKLAKTSAAVIALAPYADAFEREILLQSGVQRYLLKHINSNLLLEEIEEITSVSASF